MQYAVDYPHVVQLMQYAVDYPHAAHKAPHVVGSKHAVPVDLTVILYHVEVLGRYLPPDKSV